MQRFAGIAVLALGIVLVVWGANASESTSSDISRFFTGAMTNKAMYLLVGGAFVMIAGAVMSFPRGGKRA